MRFSYSNHAQRHTIVFCVCHHVAKTLFPLHHNIKRTGGRAGGQHTWTHTHTHTETRTHVYSRRSPINRIAYVLYG